MSLTQWFPRSAPTVECRPMAKAILSFVPTPSTLETSTGSRYLVLSTANSPPNPPISLSTPRVKVLCARYLMRCLVRLARSISTPASAYVTGAPADVGFLGTDVSFSLLNTSVRGITWVPCEAAASKVADCNTFGGLRRRTNVADCTVSPEPIRLNLPRSRSPTHHRIPPYNCTDPCGLGSKQLRQGGRDAWRAAPNPFL